MAEVNEDIAYLSDIKEDDIIPSGAVQGNFATFGANGKLADSGKKPSNYYEKTDIDDKVDALEAADADIIASIRNEYALAAYSSDEWQQLTNYTAGDFCKHGDPLQGYRCKTTHVSGASFVSDNWELVLTSAGKSAIDSLLSESGEDKAPLLSLADAYDSSKSYQVGDLVIKAHNGQMVLQVCTTAGQGAAAAFSTDITIDKSIKDRIAAHADNTNIHVTPAEKVTWNGKQNAISDIDTIRSNAATAVGRDKITIDNGNIYASGPDGSNPIRIAKYSDLPTSDGSSYAIVDAGRGTESGNAIPFTLTNRAVNVINPFSTIAAGKSFQLILPSRPQGDSGTVLARDFIVSIYGNSVEPIPISAQGFVMEDSIGETLSSLSAPVGKWTEYRFTEMAAAGNVFLVEGAADPALRAVREIEEALDAILNGSGTIDDGSGSSSGSSSGDSSGFG